jgi:hypothetical protein
MENSNILLENGPENSKRIVCESRSVGPRPEPGAPSRARGTTVGLRLRPQPLETQPRVHACRRLQGRGLHAVLGGRGPPRWEKG